jgi:O-antigen/teichoic acid export membrane protein
MAFSGAQLVLGLAGTRVLTQITDPDALGEYYLYMNLVMWLALPATSAYLFVWRNWTVARASGHDATFAGSIARGLGWQALFCVVGCLVVRAAGIMGGPWTVLLALGVTAVGQGTSQVLDGVQSLERRRVTAGVLGLLATPVRLFALATGAALLIHPSGAALLGTQAAYGTATAALSAGLMWRTIGSPYQGERPATASSADDLGLGRFLRFSLPMVVTNIAAQAAASAERWGLAQQAAPGATALFVQAMALSLAAVNAVSLPVSTYFTPLISQAAASSPQDPMGAAARAFRRFVAITALVAGLAALAAGLLAVPLTTIFFGPRYHDIAGLLPWAMTGQALYAIGQALAVAPIVVEATTRVSAVIVGSRLVYLTMLLVLPGHGDRATWFSRCFALGNVVYVLAMSAVALRAIRPRREAPTTPS